MSNKQCYICNSTTDKLKGDFKHIIFGKEITIKNAPYHQCTKCENKFYDNEKKVDWLVRDAYIASKTEIEYEEIKPIV